MHRILSKFKHSARIRSLQSGSPQEFNDAPNNTVESAMSESPRVINSTSASAPIEAFPSEIRRLILCALTLEDLFVFTRASPVYLQQYLLDPEYIRRQCLSQTLHICTVDAVYTYRTSDSQFLGNRDEDQAEPVQLMMDAYIRDRSLSPSATFGLLRQLSNSQVDDMVCFHLRIVNPLIRIFVEWALRNLTLDTEGVWKPITEAERMLSATETLRLTRAMYRYQLMCNLLGSGPYSEYPPSWYSVSGYEDFFQAFLTNFAAFELEEVRCIFDWAVNRYDKVFQAVAADLHANNPRFDDQARPPTPTGSFDFLDRAVGEGRDRREYQCGVASRGLGLLHTVLIKTPYNTSDPTQHESLVRVMQSQMTWSPFLDTIAGGLGETPQQNRRYEQSSLRDKKERSRVPMPFVGDVLTWQVQYDDNDPPPPLAWTLIWGGTYSNLYGYFIPEELARWGYVFWDAQRLEQSGGKELLMRQWEAEWSGSDPREENPF
ncbi:hypothetical protein QBC40DRAFT_283561 [Triangularia verruculosa]|uniref:F-box domain-containing protein n=1 Tax=Triangularia verruculosa TaxID=2587418 RepID=A0AAN6XDK2_9PEZI|nr:hypothetical protein QBC40DRAFT_283561 [Triangularia verruculosa]